MNAQIISRVSEIILENRYGVHHARNPVSQNQPDTVQISEQGLEAEHISKIISEKDDTGRAARVQTLKASVQSGNFQISTEVVENIAQKIAQLFL